MDAGTRVYDPEDEMPNDAVVVWRPEDMTIADWEYEVDGETYTTAESNPDYDPDEQLVLISFMHEMFDEWPEWVDADDEDLLDGIREHDVPMYGFPESRLELLEQKPDEEEGASDTDAEAETDDEAEDDEPTALPPEFDDIRARLEENGFDVQDDEDSGGIHVEKYGNEFVVEPDGTVVGEGSLRRRVTSIVGRYL